LKKIKISIFGGISKFLKLIVFGQILTNFGSFGLFWADSAAMAMADSMPSFERKKRKCHNFCKKCQNLACDGLLESPLNFPST
jgi:succinate-acetate transporter protein